MKVRHKMKSAILGFSGSGKSTLAKYIAEKENTPLLYLDTVQFTTGWQVRDIDKQKRIVSDFMKNESWVIDGNYSKLYRDERIAQADRIIILRLGRWSCLFRVIKRYFTYRNKTRESMTKGCNEKIDLEFIKWILKDGRSRAHREFLDKTAENYPDKTTVIRNQRELGKYYKSI